MLYFAILASSILALTVIDVSQTLEFDPPTLSLVDTTMGGSFKCRLNKTTDKPVKIFFEGPGIKFSECGVSIEDGNWHTVQVQGVPVYDNRTADSLVIKSRIFYEAEQHDVDYACKRTYAPGGHCSVVGDPHFSQLDGFYVSTQGAGCYDMFTHPQMSIQTTQGSCWGPATCNHACAIRYGSSIMAIDLRNSDHGMIMTSVTPNKDGIVYTGPNDKNSAHTVTLPCGSVIVLTPNRNVKEYWMDINLHLAPGYTEHGGTVNQIASGSNLKCRDGSQVSRDKVNTFMESWKVPDNDNHLLGNYKANTPVVIVGQICSIPTSLTPKPSPPAIVVLPPYVAPPPVTTTVIMTTIVPPPTTAATTTTNAVITTVGTTTGIATTTILSTTTITTTAGAVLTSSLPVSTTTMPASPPQFTEDVTTHCKKIFNVACNAVISADNHIQACIDDCHTTGGYAMAESARLSYMALCNTHTTFMSNDIVSANVQQAVTVKKSCGLGTNNCPLSCSNNGICSANGCACNPGFSGLDCSIHLSNLLCFNPVANSFVASTANATSGALAITAALASIYPPNALSYVSAAPAVPAPVSPVTSAVFPSLTTAAPSATRTPYSISIVSGASIGSYSGALLLVFTLFVI